MSENTSEDSVEVNQKPRRTPRVPTWWVGLLIVCLFGWYYYQLVWPWPFQGSFPSISTSTEERAVTAGEMANLCLTKQLCGPEHLATYQYQSHQIGQASSVNVMYVIFITAPTDGVCPTWQLPSPIQANFTGINGQPVHEIGGHGRTVTACDPYFYIDTNGVV